MSWIVKKEKAEARQKLITDAGNILKTAAKENRSMTEDENRQFEQMHGDADKIVAEISVLDRQSDAERSLEQRIGRESFETGKPKGDVEHTIEQQNEAFRQWVIGGKDSLSPEQRAAFGRLQVERRTASGLSAGTAGNGAEFVPTGFADSFMSTMKYFGGVRQAGATVIPTDDAGPFQVPLLSDSSHTGELVGENTAVADDATNDPDTSNVTLSGYIFSSKVVRVPLTLMQSSRFPVDNWLVPALAERIGRIRNTFETTGTGSSQPKGVVPAATSGLTAAATNAFTYNELLGLKHSVDAGYRGMGNCKFMFHDSTLLAAKKLVDGNSRPLWNGGNIAANIPATLDGDQYVVNNDMAQLTAGANSKVILYGDFSRYVCRDCGAIQLARLDQTYMSQLQIGFICWQLGDSNLLDTAAVKYMITAAS